MEVIALGQVNIFKIRWRCASGKFNYYIVFTFDKAIKNNPEFYIGQIRTINTVPSEYEVAFMEKVGGIL